MKVSAIDQVAGEDLQSTQHENQRALEDNNAFFCHVGLMASKMMTIVAEVEDRTLSRKLLAIISVAAFDQQFVKIGEYEKAMDDRLPDMHSFLSSLKSTLGLDSRDLDLLQKNEIFSRCHEAAFHASRAFIQAHDSPRLPLLIQSMRSQCLSMMSLMACLHIFISSGNFRTQRIFALCPYNDFWLLRQHCKLLYWLLNFFQITNDPLQDNVELDLLMRPAVDLDPLNRYIFLIQLYIESLRVSSFVHSSIVEQPSLVHLRQDEAVLSWTSFEGVDDDLQTLLETINCVEARLGRRRLHVPDDRVSLLKSAVSCSFVHAGLVYLKTAIRQVSELIDTEFPFIKSSGTWKSISAAESVVNNYIALESCEASSYPLIVEATYSCFISLFADLERILYASRQGLEPTKGHALSRNIFETIVDKVRQHMRFAILSRSNGLMSACIPCDVVSAYPQRRLDYSISCLFQGIFLRFSELCSEYEPVDAVLDVTCLTSILSFTSCASLFKKFSISLFRHDSIDVFNFSNFLDAQFPDITFLAAHCKEASLAVGISRDLIKTRKLLFMQFSSIFQELHLYSRIASKDVVLEMYMKRQEKHKSSMEVPKERSLSVSYMLAAITSSRFEHELFWPLRSILFCKCFSLFFMHFRKLVLMPCLGWNLETCLTFQLKVSDNIPFLGTLDGKRHCCRCIQCFNKDSVYHLVAVWSAGLKRFAKRFHYVASSLPLLFDRSKVTLFKDGSFQLFRYFQKPSVKYSSVAYKMLWKTFSLFHLEHMNIVSYAFVQRARSMPVKGISARSWQTLCSGDHANWAVLSKMAHHLGLRLNDSRKKHPRSGQLQLLTQDFRKLREYFQLYSCKICSCYDADPVLNLAVSLDTNLMLIKSSRNCVHEPQSSVLENPCLDPKASATERKKGAIIADKVDDVTPATTVEAPAIYDPQRPALLAKIVRLQNFLDSIYLSGHVSLLTLDGLDAEKLQLLLDSFSTILALIDISPIKYFYLLNS